MNVSLRRKDTLCRSQEWWHSGQYFGLPITRLVVEFPLQTLMYTLSSSYMEI